jgi:outer membrane protein
MSTAVGGLAILIFPMATMAADSAWAIRVRGVYLDMANRDSTGLDLSLNDKLIPEIDISYFFSSSLAAELILSYPQKHTISSGGSDIGELKHLPPTLTLQYHFSGLGPFRPYVGTGLNYTRFSSVKFDPAVKSALQPSIKKDSTGFAIQVGVDYLLTERMSLNLDVKKVQIRTDVRSASSKVGEFKADPLLIGAGLGWRF